MRTQGQVWFGLPIGPELEPYVEDQQATVRSVRLTRDRLSEVARPCEHFGWGARDQGRVGKGNLTVLRSGQYSALAG